MSQDAILAYVRGQYPYDPAALASLRHPDWTMDWPQSGERIRGHENDRAINESYPGYPKHVLLGAAGPGEQWTLSPLSGPVRVSGGGDRWIVELWLEYPSGERFFNVGLVELRGERVARETWYWAPMLEAPEWRSSLTEPLAERFEPGVVTTHGGDEAATLAVAERFVAREVDGDIVGAMRDLWAEDVVEDIPQTGERIRGRDAAVAVVEQHPSRPTIEPVRITAIGDAVALELRLDYAGDPWFAFEIARIQGGELTHVTEYFGQPFEAPEWRAAWVEITR